MTCFKYKVYLYGSEANIFECYTLNSYRTSTMSHQTAPTPYYRQPPPPPLYVGITFSSPVWKRTLQRLWLNYHTYDKKAKGKTYMAEESSHTKQLSLNHMYKIGLKKVKSNT
jgi:hypothetical protein